MDPYGKCLELISKILHFTVSPRSAWQLTQKIASQIKIQHEEERRLAFDNPLNPELPECQNKEKFTVGVLQIDGTCGAIGKAPTEKDINPVLSANKEDDDDDDTGDDDKRKQGFREVK